MVSLHHDEKEVVEFMDAGMCNRGSSYHSRPWSWESTRPEFGYNLQRPTFCWPNITSWNFHSLPKQCDYLGTRHSKHKAVKDISYSNHDIPSLASKFYGQLVISPASRVSKVLPVSTMIKDPKFKDSSEAQGKLLTVHFYKMKRRVPLSVYNGTE